MSGSPSPLVGTLETITADVRRLLAEEAHLIGQELMDALRHDELHRLRELTSALDVIAAQFAKRRPLR